MRKPIRLSAALVAVAILAGCTGWQPALREAVTQQRQQQPYDIQQQQIELERQRLINDMGRNAMPQPPAQGTILNPIYVAPAPP
jgi:PBP1b-binding outer membrane lipoprotein LpoB